MIGWLKDLTLSNNTGMYVLTGIGIAGAVIVLKIPARLVDR